MASSPIIDHFLFYVPKAQFDTVVSWYLAALAPLGYEKVMDFGATVGIGPPGRARFWISADNEKKSNFHLAFHADGGSCSIFWRAFGGCSESEDANENPKQDHKTVDAFHEAAVKAGGKDNGKPGIRAMYSPNYYGAFVADPVG